MKIRMIRFKDNLEKAAYLQNEAVKDARFPIVQAWAAQFRNIPDEMARARAILRFCTHCIDYVNDPGVEVLDDSAVALVRGFGDCDVKARLFVALCELSGLRARTQPILRGNRFPHIRAEVFVDGKWQVADPIIANSDVGRVPSNVNARTSWR